jgi:hypothetical protein
MEKLHCLMTRRAMLTLLLLFPTVGFANDIIPTSRAREFTDKMITVEGTVTATRKDGRNTFLTFGPAAIPDLSVAITPPLLLSEFPPHPEKFYQGKTLRVTGRVYIIRDHPEMLISAADRIEVVSDNEPAGIREALRPQPSSTSPLSSPSTAPPPLPRELVTGPETKLLDLRPSTPLAAAPSTSRLPDACSEAQGLWKQVSQDLVPHLRAYTVCLEKASLGCDPEGEKVALGMLAVQQAQKRVKMTCR